MPPDPTLSTMAGSLRLWAARRNWSPTDLAHQAGLAAATVQLALSGEHDPGLVVAKKLADACGVGVDALIAGFEPTPAGRCVPASYVAAGLACMLPVGAGFARLPFTVALSDGTRLRVHISAADALALATHALQQLPQLLDGLPACQSPMSAASPSAAVSTPLESDQV